MLRWHLIIGMIALASGGAIAWEADLRDRVIPRRFGSVVPGAIYRSAQVEANLADDVLRDNQIRHIVNLGVFKVGNDRHEAEMAAAREMGVTWVELGLGGDGRGDPQRYVEALQAMVDATKSGHAVLVHCSAGVNRTGGAVALYRVLLQGWTPEQAVNEMLDFDFDPHENRKLLPYLDEHLPGIAAVLVSRGVIAGAPAGLPSFAAAARVQ